MAEDLAKLLVDSTSGKMTKLFVVSSGMSWIPFHHIVPLTKETGSEAVEAALKLARQYFLELPTPQPQRTKYIGRLPSYHGVTLGGLAAGGHTIRREPFKPLLSTAFSHVSPCYAYRGKKEGETDEAYVARLAAELDAEFQRLGPENVCAFIAEPIAGNVSVTGTTCIPPACYLEIPIVTGISQPVHGLCPRSTRLFPRHESRVREIRRALNP